MEENERTARRLDHWKAVLKKDASAWQAERNKMDERELLYRGDKGYRPVVSEEDKRPNGQSLQCYHVRNIVAENIESMVDSTIPAPKVTPRRKCDEALAQRIEHMLRWKVAQLKLHSLNDMAERTVPIQGAVAYLVEWDAEKRDGEGLGDIAITYLHPKMLVPQDGVYTSLEDMDHCAVKLPYTKRAIRRTFGVTVEEENDSDTQSRSIEGSTAEDIVTLNLMLYRRDDGRLGRFAWVGDTVVQDIDNYQARKMRRCRSCGWIEQELPTVDAADEEEAEISGEAAQKPHRCPRCEGTEFETADVDWQEIFEPMELQAASGTEIRLEGAETRYNPNTGEYWLEPKKKVPYYVPASFPIILQKNISLFGQLLGDSDVDKIADQQNTLKRIDKKILDRMVKAGTIVTLPADTHITTDPEDQRIVILKDPAQKTMIDVIQLDGNLVNEMNVRASVYEESRQILGVTDSFQGRKDSTATSGTAKQFSAAQAAGRMESKRVMKKEAWAKIYEAIFQNMLAYADEPRSYKYTEMDGSTTFEEWNRWDFLEQDAAGDFWWNDRFIFECDESSTLANNRQQMWQEITSQLQAGGLGNPQDTNTLVLYWGLMEEQHYPAAAAIKRRLEERLQQEQMLQQMMQQTGSQPVAAGMEQQAMMPQVPGTEMPGAGMM